MKTYIYLILSIFLFISCEKDDLMINPKYHLGLNDTIIINNDTVINDTTIIIDSTIVIIDTVIIDTTIFNVDTTIINVDTIINNYDTTIYVAKYDWISTTKSMVAVDYPRLNIFVTTDSIILQFVYANKNTYTKYSKFEKGVDVFSHAAYHTVNGSYEPYTVIDSTRNYIRFSNAGDPNTLKFIVVLETDTTIALQVGTLIFTLKKPELIFTK